MDLLPRNSSDFSDESYWHGFFSKRSSAFEWYGDYAALRPLLLAQLKPTDRVLHVGCGNSTLGYDLYADGVKRVTNIDLSELVVSQMQAKYAKQLARQDGLSFVRMDVLDLQLAAGEFDAVIDKGTLDALMVDGEPATCARVQTMFAECERVLRAFGRYVCVSLLQPHVLRTLVDWAADRAAFNHIVRVQKVPANPLAAGESDASTKFPVFAVILIKLKPKQPADRCMFELCLTDDSAAKAVRTFDREQVLDSVKQLQNYARIQHHLANRHLDADEEICLELFDAQDAVQFKYRLHIVEQISRENRQKFGVFLVPVGRNREFLFGTREGRRQLAKLCSAQRLVVVQLNANYPAYPPLDELKEQLSSKVVELAPQPAAGSTKIPIMTVEEKRRELLQEGCSEFSGKFSVADVPLDDEEDEAKPKYMLRQLIFESNRNVIQSEARVKLVRHKKKLKKFIDHSYLACNHHAAIFFGFALYKLNLPEPPSTIRALLVGLGGGCFASYIQNNLCIPGASFELDVVEIDPEMVPISKELFALDCGNEQSSPVTINLIVDDGLRFVRNCAESGTRYDLIMFDVDNKDSQSGLSCPPAAFVEDDFLDLVNAILEPAGGLFMLNLAARNAKLKQQVVQQLGARFDRVLTYAVPDETNTICYGFKRADRLAGELLGKSVQLTERVCLFERKFAEIVKHKSCRPGQLDQAKFVEHLQ